MCVSVSACVCPYNTCTENKPVWVCAHASFQGDLLYLVHSCQRSGGKEPPHLTHLNKYKLRDKKTSSCVIGEAVEQWGQERGPGRCIMRKYHLSALNLFWGLSLLSSQCSGRLCDNTNAETQTGNNSSPIGGPSDLGLPLSLTHAHTQTHTPSFTLSLSVSR